MNNDEVRNLLISGYQLWKSGDLAGLGDKYAEDAEYVSPKVEGIPFGGYCKGREQIIAAFKEILEAQQPKEFQIQMMLADGDRGAVYGHSVWVVKATGKSFESDWAHFFEIKDGKVTRMCHIWNTAAGRTAYSVA